MNVTPRQMDILRLIRDYRVNSGFSPTMQELADKLDISKVTVFQHVEALEEKGLLRRSRHRARSLVLTEKVQFPDSPAGSLPLMGYIAAGSPIEAIQGDQKLDINSMFSGRGNTFLLEVRGDSMIDEQIRDGDFVVVQPNEEPKNGQTVVALLEDGEATLKQFHREAKRIRLQPANKAYEPIYVDPDKVAIQGLVVGVLRAYR